MQSATLGRPLTYGIWSLWYETLNSLSPPSIVCCLRTAFAATAYVLSRRCEVSLCLMRVSSQAVTHGYS